MTTSNASSREQALQHIQELSIPLESSDDLDPLLERIGGARVVMLGEATHGTHEFYVWRSKITQRLILEKGFHFLAVEGDWPDCYKLNRYIKGYQDSGLLALEVLQNFNRWPTWMWANWEIEALCEWLKRYNLSHPDHSVGFYGLDVYSLWDSLYEVINYLEKVDPHTAELAKNSANCFENYTTDKDGHTYAFSTQLYPHDCEEDVIKMLQEVRSKSLTYDYDEEATFNAEQNAMVAANAEKYFRTMGKGSGSSWNVRDEHMMETLKRLLVYHGPESKAIVWAHNSHIGDARATAMKSNGLINIGQLAREYYKEENVVLVGFGTYSGSTIAGSSWNADMENVSLSEAKKDSWEELLHAHAPTDQLLIFKSETELNKVPHRAVGVVYDPSKAHTTSFVTSDVHQRYDAFIHIDQSTALYPFHIKPNGMKEPDTYPFGV